MTKDKKTEPVSGATQRRGRGPDKNFPVMVLEESLVWAQGILDHGVNGKIRRLTLMDKLNLSPGRSRTMRLESSSLKYGLTIGGKATQFLEITDKGRTLLEGESSSRSIREIRFELAIQQIDPFNKLYEKLKGEIFLDAMFLEYKFRGTGIVERDRAEAAKVFAANVRYIGLLREISGSDYLCPIEELIEEETSIDVDVLEGLLADAPVETVAPVEKNGAAAVVTNRPALHIDIQVHIDAKSSAEQIDHIFASMARHLYGNGS